MSDVPGAARPPAPEPTETFTKMLVRKWQAWYPRAKHDAAVILTKKDAFVGGVLSGLELAAEELRRRGDAEGAAAVLLIPDRR